MARMDGAGGFLFVVGDAGLFLETTPPSGSPVAADSRLAGFLVRKNGKVGTKGSSSSTPHIYRSTHIRAMT